MATQAEFDRAKERLRELAARWRVEPWYARTVAEAPGPVAHEVRALAEVLDAGDPGGALLQLRDTVETLVKFCTLVLARDLIANGTPDEAQACRQALFGSPLLLGKWWGACRSLS